LELDESISEKESTKNESISKKKSTKNESILEEDSTDNESNDDISTISNSISTREQLQQTIR
jgi:hypothetical protein